MANRRIGFLSMEVIAVIGIVVLAASIFGGAALLSADQDDDQENFNGVLQKVQGLQELGGSALTVTEQSLNSTGIVDDSTLEMSYSLGLNGSQQKAAFGFTVSGDGGVSSVTLSGGLNSATTTSAIELQNACIVPDVQENTLTCDDAVMDATISGSDTIENTVRDAGLAEGDYGLLVEFVTIDTSKLSADQDLYNVDLTVENDDEEPDELHATVDTKN